MAENPTKPRRAPKPRTIYEQVIPGHQPNGRVLWKESTNSLFPNEQPLPSTSNYTKSFDVFEWVLRKKIAEVDRDIAYSEVCISELELAIQQDELEIQTIDFLRKPLRKMPIKLTPPPVAAQETIRQKRKFEFSVYDLQKRRKELVADLYEYMTTGANVEEKYSSKDDEIDD